MTNNEIKTDTKTIQELFFNQMKSLTMESCYNANINNWMNNQRGCYL